MPLEVLNGVFDVKVLSPLKEVREDQAYLLFDQHRVVYLVSHLEGRVPASFVREVLYESEQGVVSSKEGETLGCVFLSAANDFFFLLFYLLLDLKHIEPCADQISRQEEVDFLHHSCI